MPSERDDYDKSGDQKSDHRVRLLERAVAYYKSGRMRETLECFASDHAHEFTEAATDEGKTGEHEHKEYLRLFEDVLSAFVAQEGCTTADFLNDCRDALDDKYCALFEEHQHHWFVDALLCSMEYDAFYAMMVAHAQQAASRRK